MPQHTCPKCGSPMYLDTANELWRCRACLHKLPAPREDLEKVRSRLIATSLTPAVQITHRGTVDSRARSIFYTGHDALLRGDKAGAAQYFRSALAVQPEFADPHLWLAKLADDPKHKRDHLSAVLAHDPGHMEALRMMMVLNGEITEEEAQQAAQNPDAPAPRRADGVTVVTETLLCPVCGGHLTEDFASKQIICRFCGHQEPLKRKTAGGAALGAALLKRRAQPVRWVVGDRILQCQQCGAERTIPGVKLSSLCPFCGSNHVVTTDALRSFEQPEAVVRFSIGEEAARALIADRLKAVGERFSGLFDDNRVKRMLLEGIYLPYWVFDAYMDVTVTMTEKPREGHDRAGWLRNPTGYRTMRMSGGALGILIPAVKSPSPKLMSRIANFDIGTLVPYEPKLLARYPAELYSVDFDDASLTARSRASEKMREEYGTPPDKYTEISVMSMPLQMTFFLALMPVWVATLHERDGDIRPALVNGQTGAVSLGKAQKTRKR